MTIRTVLATRYVTPLREGGSLPALVEADDDGIYVVKFRGAGQGPKALIAELVAGEVMRALGLPAPEIVFVHVDPLLARSEPDGEVQALVQASAGLNLALDYLPGSFDYSPLLTPTPDPALASAVVWADAYLTNVDRTPRNPNLLLWHRRLWLIDHGAALYFHHFTAGFSPYVARARSPFPQVRDHVLLPVAADLEDADRRLAPLLTPRIVEDIVALVPDEWLGDEDDGAWTGPVERRAAYTAYLLNRLAPPRPFVEEAIRARAALD